MFVKLMLRVSGKCRNEKKLGKIGAGEGFRVLDFVALPHLCFIYMTTLCLKTLQTGVVLKHVTCPFMDVKTILELWGVGVVKITVVQKWDPN